MLLFLARIDQTLGSATWYPHPSINILVPSACACILSTKIALFVLTRFLKFWGDFFLVFVEELESCDKIDVSLRFGFKEAWEKAKWLEDLPKFRQSAEKCHSLSIRRASI